MTRRRRPPSQGWKTFLRNHADGIASMDLFVVPTISFRLLYGFLILQHPRRELVWLGVTARPSAHWIARQLTEACGWQQAPRYIVRSFAQFEREVTSERIRDKIAASKRKGLWVGGIAPLGYETKDRKIVVVEEEAERVRTIFRRYLELGSLNLLMADLRERGIVTKVQSLKTGRTVGGIPFTRGPLAHFLRNRFYIGEVAFKGEVLPGEQPAILDRDLFDAVAKLSDQRNNHTVTRAKSESLLIGRIYDDRGNRMTPSHARKGGIKYRYYLSSPLLHGQPGRVGLVRRVPAAEVEALVECAVREHLGDSTESEDRDLIRNHVVRVEVQADQLAVELKAEKAPSDPPNAVDHDRLVLCVPWKKTPMKRRRDIIVPTCVSPHDGRPIRAETRATLGASIARGRRWLDEIVAGTMTSVEQIAARDKCSIRQVNMTISLAFLAPDLVQAVPRGGPRDQTGAIEEDERVPVDR